MSSTTPAAALSSRRWLALGLIAAAQFMVIMDTSIIGVALPEIQQDLEFTPEGLRSSRSAVCFFWAAGSPTCWEHAASSSLAG